MVFKFGKIQRTYQHIRRYRQIIATMVKYGFVDIVDILRSEQYLGIGLDIFFGKRLKDLEVFSRAERIRMAFEELGPTFIKLGQILSCRPDLIPVEYVQEFDKLLDDIPSFPFNQVQEIVEADLSASLDSIFEFFKNTPIAAASIGQVHKARLVTGEDVVVKVQRPDIHDIIRVDLEIMHDLSILMEKTFAAIQIQKPSIIVDEIANTMGKELDYTIEALNMARFGKLFKNDKRIYVPHVFFEFTTERVLVTDFIDGIKITSPAEEIKKTGADAKVFVDQAVDLLLKQIFDYGFFHADPHQANIFGLKDGRLCFIDFGIMGRIDLKTREAFIDLAFSLVKKDVSKTLDAILNIMLWDEDIDLKSAEKDINEFIELYFNRHFRNINVRKLLNRLLLLLKKHNLRMPPELFLMLKCMATMESLCRRVNPDVDILKKAAPFFLKNKLSRYNPLRVAGGVMKTTIDYADLVKAFPIDLQDISTKLRHGRLKLNLEHVGIPMGLFKKIEQLGNRLIIGLVVVSLIISSALIFIAKTPPFIYGIPVFGICGFILACIIGIWLLISIFLRGRL